MSVSAYFKNPEKMFQLAVTTNSVVTALLPLMLQLLSSFSEKLYNQIETFDADAEENKQYADRMQSVAKASTWIAVLGGKALMFLNGFQTGKGKDNLTGKQAKVVQAFLVGFSMIAFAMLFTLCGMGIKMYDSAASFNEKVCTFPSSTTTTTSQTEEEKEASEQESKSKAEDSATALYNTYIASLTVFGVLFCIYVWFTAEYAKYAPIKGSKKQVRGGAPAVSGFFAY